MLIRSDSISRNCVLAAALSVAFASTAQAEGFDLESWSKTFAFLGEAAGRYDACTRRDHLDLFAELATELAPQGDDQAALILDDIARSVYFESREAGCDILKLDAFRADIQTWEAAIRKAANQ